MNYEIAEDSNDRRTSGRGMVYLVGAGPGDPDLITVKALRCLRLADVVLYDRLVSPDLLAEARPGAVLIYVGKGTDCHILAQEEINTLLITYALQSRVVVRLKGGDPFIFGRGGEEALALANAGVPYEIVPGVSSAIAVPAYAGIPVTHRDYASSVTIVTGHEVSPCESEQSINWEALARTGGTLVILMGVKALPHLSQRLITYGLDPETPAAVIQRGTTEQQRVVTGTITDISERAKRANIGAPAITVIGAVVSLSNILNWYEEIQESLPLAAAY